MADNVVNVKHVALLEEEVFEIMDEVVVFVDNSGPTVAWKTRGTSGKKALVSPGVMPPNLIRVPSPPVNEEIKWEARFLRSHIERIEQAVDITEEQLKVWYENPATPIPYRIPRRQTAPGGQGLQVTPSSTKLYYHFSAPRCVTWDESRNRFAIMVPNEVYMQGLRCVWFVVNKNGRISVRSKNVTRFASLVSGRKCASAQWQNYCTGDWCCWPKPRPLIACWPAFWSFVSRTCLTKV